MFRKEIYSDRRKALKQNIHSGILLFPGNDESPMNYADNTYRFRQDSTFLYYFGLDFAGLSAIIDVDNNDEIIFGDELTIDHIVWMGNQPTLKEKALSVGIEVTAPSGRLREVLHDAISKNRPIHFLPPYRGENIIKLHKLLNQPISQIEETFSREFVKAVIAQREIKSEEEINEIEKAVDISTEMHIAAMKTVKPGITEAQVAAKVREVALSYNTDISFPIIATINGQTLHNHYHGNTLKSGQMFLLDAGAESPLHYAGDLSSTMPVDKKFTNRQKEIYQISLLAHQAVIEELKPGNEFRNAHFAAVRTIASGMKDLGLMKGNIDDAIALGAHAMFFQCGTGHMLGLDVHDMENLGEIWIGYDGAEKSKQFGLKSLRLAKKLKPGFVLTIEPGIYFIPELMDLWKSENRFTDFIDYNKLEAYRDFGGIRNEEDFLITQNGCRRLGKQKPKSIQDIESIKS